MKRVLSYTFLHFFVAGGLALIIPLLLLDRHVSLAQIGIILSFLPLVFLLYRLVFALIADRAGWSFFFVLASIFSIISSLLYSVANSVFTFLLGKITEGTEESSYWCVNRTAVYSLSPNQKQKEATRMRAIMFLATASCIEAAGFGSFYVGFSITLWIIVTVSTLMVIPALMLWRTRKNVPQIAPRPKIAPRRPRRMFWLCSAALVLYSFSTYPLFALAMPLFMNQQLGYNYLTIGISFMVYNLFYAFSTLVSLGKKLNAKRVILQSTIMLSATFLLFFSGFYFPALLVTIALVNGLTIGFF
jgi:MFS family permease